MSGVAERVAAVRARIEAAATRAGRDAADVTLLAVTKEAAPQAVAEAASAGVRDFGENRAQELDRKRAEVGAGARWHYLGAVQTNKVRMLDGVRLVHGLVRVREAAALQARAERTGESRDVLVEVNAAGERTKRGVAPERLSAFLEGLRSYPLVRPRGLMIVAPQTENHEDVRWVFSRMRELRDTHLAEVPTLRELSMGMSDDFEIAIEEGSTIVRVGRAIFGEGEA